MQASNLPRAAAAELPLSRAFGLSSRWGPIGYLPACKWTVGEFATGNLQFERNCHARSRTFLPVGFGFLGGWGQDAAVRSLN
jgi:hypothetical protein